MQNTVGKLKESTVARKLGRDLENREIIRGLFLTNLLAKHEGFSDSPSVFTFGKFRNR